MARPAAKTRAPKHLVALAVVAILGLVLVADFLWASSSSSSPVWSSRLISTNAPAAPVAKKVTPPLSHAQCLGMLNCCLLLKLKGYALRGRGGEGSVVPMRVRNLGDLLGIRGELVNISVLVGSVPAFLLDWGILPV